MRVRTAALTAAITLTVLGPATPNASGAGCRNYCFLEEVDLPSLTAGTPIPLKTKFVEGRKYKFVVSGTVTKTTTVFSDTTVQVLDAFHRVSCTRNGGSCFNATYPEKSNHVWAQDDNTPNFSGGGLQYRARGGGTNPDFQRDSSYTLKLDALKGQVDLANFCCDPKDRLTNTSGGFHVKVYGKPTQELEIRWAMADRFKRRDNGTVDYPTTPSEVTPKSYRVNLKVRKTNGHPCYPEIDYKARVDGHKAELKPRYDTPSRCDFYVKLPREDTFDVDVYAQLGGEKVDGSAQVTVRDLLIVGIGDSAGSGEGSPHSKLGVTSQWEDQRCHRSSLSQQAIAAERIEDADEHSSVTFVHLACSGASVSVGLLGPYKGIEEAEPPLPPQLDDVQRLIGARRIDALEVSIGVNDARFGPVIEFCRSTDDCPNQVFEDGFPLRQWLGFAIASLPDRYAELSQRLATMLPADRVYLTRYPDLLHDDNGTLCQKIVDNLGPGVVDAGEIGFLNSDFAGPLDAQVGAAASRHGWNVTSGATEAFRTHGYCASDNWIVGLLKSTVTQKNVAGTLHPNPKGYRTLGKLLATELKPDLLPGGEPRPLAPPKIEPDEDR